MKTSGSPEVFLLSGNTNMESISNTTRNMTIAPTLLKRAFWLTYYKGAFMHLIFPNIRILARGD